jgi:hypothetical protein
MSMLSIGTSGSAMLDVVLVLTTFFIGVCLLSVLRFLFFTFCASCWLASCPDLLPPPGRKSTGCLTSNCGITMAAANAKSPTWIKMLSRKEPAPILFQYSTSTLRFGGGGNGAL